ncbi:MAG: DsbA family protein [Chloroflexota bacterium]
MYSSKQTSQRMASNYQLSPRKWLMLVAFASFLGLALGAGMMILSLLSVSSSLAAPTIIGRDPTGVERRTKGAPNAPVVITTWSDYQCSACARFALNREPVLERLYEDTGKVRFVYRNMPFIGPESFWAAEAAECAADQGRYFDYRNLLFQRLQGENRGGFSIANLKAFAAELGLDQPTFNACLEQGKHRAAIQAEAREGDNLGIDATPTFFINGRMIDGIPSIEAFQKIIDEELAKQ